MACFRQVLRIVKEFLCDGKENGTPLTANGENGPSVWDDYQTRMGGNQDDFDNGAGEGHDDDNENNEEEGNDEEEDHGGDESLEVEAFGNEPGKDHMPNAIVFASLSHGGIVLHHNKEEWLEQQTITTKSDGEKWASVQTAMERPLRHSSSKPNYASHTEHTRFGRRLFSKRDFYEESI